MDMPVELSEALSIQYHNEIENMLKYKQIEAYFKKLRLENISGIFRKQSLEEHEHAEKVFDHLTMRVGGEYLYQPQECPKLEITSPKDAGDLYLLLEKKTTESLEELYTLASELGSSIDLEFILEMLKYQKIEEDEADRLKKLLENMNPYALDLELG